MGKLFNLLGATLAAAFQISGMIVCALLTTSMWNATMPRFYGVVQIDSSLGVVFALLFWVAAKACIHFVLLREQAPSSAGRRSTASKSRNPIGRARSAY